MDNEEENHPLPSVSSLLNDVQPGEPAFIIIEGSDLMQPLLSSSLTQLRATQGSEGSSSNLARRSILYIICRYYHQLIFGCGNSSCTNTYCAVGSRNRTLQENTSSIPYNPSEAAVLCLKLAQIGSSCFCDSHDGELPDLEKTTFSSDLPSFKFILRL